MSAVSIIVPTLGGERLGRMLRSVADPGVQTIVVDNGSGGSVAATCAGIDGVEVISLDRNEGYTRAINLGVRRADGDRVILLNDDCVCEPRFAEAITAPMDPTAGVTMVAGVMRDWRDPELIDSAGMELDRTLLVFDYLNGEPVSRLRDGVEDPIGPSAAAAAFDREAFLGVGGFDEALFAYWEDVDLVLRLRRAGMRCVLATDAVGDHEHSATLGSGSARKNYLMGFGRGYLLRKWGVLNARRLPGVLVREAALCAGQAIVDRNLAGTRGRVRGYMAARVREGYPRTLDLGRSPTALENLRRRAQRRARLRAASRPREIPRTFAAFHLADTSGPSRSLEAELNWLSSEAPVDVAIPGPGDVARLFVDGVSVVELDYEALTKPEPSLGGTIAALWRLSRDVRTFRAAIRDRRPGLVLEVTTMLPALLIAARLERVPALVYCGELFDRGHRGGLARRLASGALATLTTRLAEVIMACSDSVAAQFEGSPVEVVTVYPPVDDRYGAGDGEAFRSAHGIPAEAPVIASIGYVTEGRGQDVLIRAMPAILERFPDARYVLVGAPFPRPQDIAFRDRLRALVAELGLERSVIVAGHYEAVADVYSAAAVIVNPARFNEPFGRVPFEAAIADRPAVVTRVGAVPELLTDRSSAMVVEPDDAAALAEAVATVLADPALGQRLAAGAREVIEAKLTPAHSLAAFRRSIERALERSE